MLPVSLLTLEIDTPSLDNRDALLYCQFVMPSSLVTPEKAVQSLDVAPLLQ